MWAPKRLTFQNDQHLHKAYQHVINMDCPICNQSVPADEFLLHAMLEHPQFFAVWASFSMPTFAPNANLFTPEPDNDQIWMEEEEHLTYEALLELCEEIGYHKIGVKNIDEVAPTVDKPPSDDWICAICLENLKEVESMRRIHVCNHVFCASCIEQWFKENKICPVCKTEVQASTSSTLDDVD